MCSNCTACVPSPTLLIYCGPQISRHGCSCGSLHGRLVNKCVATWAPHEHGIAEYFMGLNASNISVDCPLAWTY